MKNIPIKFVTTLLVLLIQAGNIHAQTVISNVNGYTSSDTGMKSFSAMVIDDDGRVVATGDASLLSEYADATNIDAGGKTLLPGLIDAHGHVSGHGLAMTNLNLMGTPTLDDALAAIETFAADNPQNRWITGRGWNQVLWPVQAFPSAADIDAVVSDRPVWLRRVDGHAGWANSKALTIAGIDDDTEDPIGGKILRDADGHATGVLIDKAMDLVETAVPTPDKADLRRAVTNAGQALLAEGITSTHDAGVDLADVEVFLSMADNGELPLRLYVMLGGSGKVLDEVGSPIRQYGGDFLDIAAVKIYSDGALGSRGAAMLEPYSDDGENRGLAFWTPSELLAQVKKANDMGFQVAVHAIGDLGNRMTLDTFEQVQGGKPSPLRNRIEHAQIIALDDIPRFAELGVIASMQATHATSDKNMAEDRIGADRILGGYAWRRLLESGAILANGSDYPVELSNPFHGLYAAVTRQDRAGSPDGGWYSDQALTRAEALHSFTLAAAYAAHQEQRLGSLEAGKWADFIIIDRDYFSVPADEIDDIKVLQTWIAGKRVFNAGNSQ